MLMMISVPYLAEVACDNVTVTGASAGLKIVSQKTFLGKIIKYIESDVHCCFVVQDSDVSHDGSFQIQSAFLSVSDF